MTDQPQRRLRIAEVIVTPVLVWDDGEELHAGPEVTPVRGPLSALALLAEQLPAEIARIEAEAISPPD